MVKSILTILSQDIPESPPFHESDLLIRDDVAAEGEDPDLSPIVAVHDIADEGEQLLAVSPRQYPGDISSQDATSEDAQEGLASPGGSVDSWDDEIQEVAEYSVPNDASVPVSVQEERYPRRDRQPPERLVPSMHGPTHFYARHAEVLEHTLPA